MDRKVSYEELEFEVICFETEDVIDASPLLDTYEGEVTP